MRDIKRIKPFLEKFEELWSKYPDLRFGQIVSVLDEKTFQDLFYIEDESFLKLLETGFEDGKKQ